MRLLIIFTLFILSACGTSPQITEETETQIITGRQAQSTNIYRVQVPQGWKRQNTDPQILTDTREPLCCFSLEDGKITIAIHNFPAQTVKTRIPPEAQIARWKKQMEKVEQIDVLPQAFGGFVGLRLTVQGKINDQDIAFTAWAMQLAGEHFHRLPLADQRGDYTIKAVGPPLLMENHLEEIIAFARTFELVEEIPEAP